MNLTKEYFDKQLKNLATKSDLKNFATRDEIDARFEKQTRILMDYTDQQTEKLAAMVATGFEDIREKLDVQERVERLEKDVRKIKEALHVQ